MNTDVHDTTKQIPYGLVFGQPPRAIFVPDVNFWGQLYEDVLKPCDREISEEGTKDKEQDDEGNEEKDEETEKDEEEKEKEDVEKEEEHDENRVHEEEKEDEDEEKEDEEKEEEDEKIAKDSGDVDKDDGEEEEEDNLVEKEMEGTYVHTVARELQSNIEERNKTTAASDVFVYQYSVDSEKCDGHDSDRDENGNNNVQVSASIYVLILSCSFRCIGGFNEVQFKGFSYY